MNKRPHIIEIVGMAGTGKSTLRKAMMERNKSIRFFDHRGRISFLPFLFKLTIAWLPLYLIQYRHTRWFSMREIRNMGYLDTWISRIGHGAQLDKKIYIIEPGSVYWLSSLQDCGPEIIKHPRFHRWWKKKFQSWAMALDAIIWLDAPEEVSLHRINSRDQWHQLLECSDERALDELRYFRKHYEKLVLEMTSQYPVKLFAFRSDQISTDRMVEQIFSDTDFWARLGQPSIDAWES